MTIFRIASSRSALAALLAFVSLAAAGAAGAQPLLGLGGPEAEAAPRTEAAPRLVLPPPTGQRVPYRETKRGECSTEGRSIGFCRHRFRDVPANQLLQIDNVSCATVVEESNPNKFFSLANAAGLGTLPIAVIPAAQVVEFFTGAVVVTANVGGPYFFEPGEAVFILSAGYREFKPICTISGTLAPTN